MADGKIVIDSTLDNSGIIKGVRQQASEVARLVDEWDRLPDTIREQDKLIEDLSKKIEDMPKVGEAWTDAAAHLDDMQREAYEFFYSLEELVDMGLKLDNVLDHAKLELEYDEAIENSAQLTERLERIPEELENIRHIGLIDFAGQAEQAAQDIDALQQRMRILNEHIAEEKDPAMLKTLQYNLLETQAEYDKFIEKLSQPIQDIMAIRSLEEQIENLQERIEQLSDEPYSVEVEADLTEAWEEIERLQAELDALNARPAQAQLNTVAESVKGLGSTMQGTRMSARQMGAAFGMAASGAGSMRGMINAVSGMIFMMGKGFDAAKLKAIAFWAAATLGVSLLINGLTKIVELFNKFTESVQEAAKAILDKIVKIVPRIINWLKSMNISLSGIAKGIGKIYNNLMNSVKNASRSTTAFKMISSAITDVKQSISNWILSNKELQVSLSQIKTNLLTAFAPAIEAVIPPLTALLNVIVAITAAIAQFMATLFGVTVGQARQSAINLEKQAAGIGKVGGAAKGANKFLATFDELQIPPSSSEGGGGGGGAFDFGDIIATSMEWIDKLAEIVRKFFKEANFDGWFEVGATAAQKFTEALRKIPWGEIQKGAKNAAINLAGLLSGFLSDEEMWKAVGNFFAELFNTINTFLADFAERFKWSETGKAIASGINEFFADWDVDEATRAFNAWALGLLDMLKAAIEKTEWGEIGDKIGDFIAGIKWSEILPKITSGALDLALGISEMLAKAFTPENMSEVAKGIVAGLNALFEDPEKWKSLGLNVWGVVDAIASLLSEVVSDFPIEEMVESIKSFFDGFLEKVREDPEAFRDKVVGIIDGIVEIISEVIDALPIDEITEIIGGIIENINWTEVVALISKIDAIKKIPGEILKAIKKEITPAIFRNAGKKFVEGIENIFTGEGLLAALKRIGKFLLTNIVSLIFPPMFFANLISLIKPDFIETAIDSIAGFFEGMLEAMGNVGAWIKKHIVDPIVNAVKWLLGISSPSIVFAEIGTWLMEGLFNGLLEMLDVIISFFTELWESVKEIFTTVGEWFGEIFAVAWQAIQAAWTVVTEWFATLWESIAEIWNVVVDWFENLFTDAWNGIKSAWSSVSEWFSGVWDSITEVWQAVTEWFANLFGKAWTGIKNAWTDVKTWFSGIWDGIKEAFSTVTDWFGEVFSKAWDNIKKVWETVTGWFTDNVTTPLAEGFKSAFNKILGAAESFVNFFIRGINAIINALNEISFDVPDWVPIIGGKTFGFGLSNISEISIPRLERGAIVDSATMAVIGERGREAVLPLENNTGWMDMLAEKIVVGVAAAIGSSNQPIEITMELDRINLGRVFYNLSGKENKRVGVRVQGSMA